jgi:hypothetical protein
MERARVLGRSIEIGYLSTLRIVVLVVATVFVIAAAVMLFNGLLKLSTSTAVKEAPVAISPAEVISGVATKKDINSPASSAEATRLAGEKKAFDRWMAEVFSKYYAPYRQLAIKYNKSDDAILTPETLASSLGYSLDALQAGEDKSVFRFVNDANYATQIIETANGLTVDARVNKQLQQYRSAQKTAQTCSTDFVSRRMWDSNSVLCANWYEDPVGCSVVREVPVQRCVASYPEGITSPAQAFAQMDQGFKMLWESRQSTVAEEAATKRAALETKKASAGPTLLQALSAFGAFLAIMFLFLIVAIERHLRRLAAIQTIAASAPIVRA